MKGSVQGNEACPGSHSTMVLGLEMAMTATGEAGPAAVYIRGRLQSWDQLLNAVAEIFSRTVWILGVTLLFGGEGVCFFFFFSCRKREEKWIKQQKTGRSLSDTYFSNCPLLARSTHADVSCWPQQCDVGAWRWTMGFVVLGSIHTLLLCKCMAGGGRREDNSCYCDMNGYN